MAEEDFSDDDRDDDDDMFERDGDLLTTDDLEALLIKEVKVKQDQKKQDKPIEKHDQKRDQLQKVDDPLDQDEFTSTTINLK